MTYWPGVAWGGAESSGVHEEGTSRCLAWGVDGPCLSPDFTRGSFCESEEDTGPRAVPGMSGPSQVPSGRRNRARVHAGSLTKATPEHGPSQALPPQRWSQASTLDSWADSAGMVALGGPGQHLPLTRHPRLGRAMRQVSRFQPTELTTPAGAPGGNPAPPRAHPSSCGAIGTAETLGSCGCTCPHNASHSP